MTDVPTSGVVVRDLVVRYEAGRDVVGGVSFRVPPGGVIGLVGGNGAGKSTTMRVIAGLRQATSGAVLVDGHDLSTRSGLHAARSVIGYCPDTGGLPPELTPAECIGLALSTSGRLDLWPAAYELAERLDLTGALHRPTREFSHGMSRRTSVLLAVIGAANTRVLILDEPFDGVDVAGAAVVTELIGEARANGVAVIVSTHEHGLATRICDQIAVMANGRIVAAVHGDQVRSRRGERRYAQLLERTLIRPAA